MQRLLFLLSLLFFSLFLAAQPAKKALLVGIDGCRPDALEAAATPNLDALIANGLFAPDALNDDITISGPGWSAILCGVWSEKHLVTGNDFGTNDYENYPSLFRYMSEYNPDLSSVSVCHWSPINEYIIQDQANFTLNVSSDAEVASQAAAYLGVNDPDVVFLHFDETDYAGHGYGFAPDVPEYIAAIEGVDTYLGTVLSAIEERPEYAAEDWLVVVTTDHGGLGQSHGGNSPEEENVFIIASGSGVPTQVIEKDSTISVFEVENCLDENIELQFDGSNDFVFVPENTVLDFGSDQDFTLECRVRTGTSADVSIIGTKDWDSGLNKGVVFSFKYPSGPEWKVNIGDGSNRVDIDNGGQIADGEWHTLSVSFDRDGMMRMYEDGLFLEEADISGIGDISTGEGLYFGTDFNQAYDFTGAIAEVRLWNKVLSPEDIETYYCEPVEASHPDYASLTGYWKMNEGQGAIEVLDASPTQNHGTITAAAWETPDTLLSYDYSTTGRLTDIVPTVFDHLCIPIQETWNLDGNSLITECVTTDTEEELSDLLRVDIRPNPASHSIFIQASNSLAEELLSFSLMNAAGDFVLHRTFSGSEHIDITHLPVGLYLAVTETPEGKRTHRKLMICH